jgi:hypothetical protein
MEIEQYLHVCINNDISWIAAELELCVSFQERIEFCKFQRANTIK